MTRCRLKIGVGAVMTRWEPGHSHAAITANPAAGMTSTPRFSMGLRVLATTNSNAIAQVISDVAPVNPRLICPSWATVEYNTRACRMTAAVARTAVAVPRPAGPGSLAARRLNSSPPTPRYRALAPRFSSGVNIESGLGSRDAKRSSLALLSYQINRPEEIDRICLNS